MICWSVQVAAHGSRAHASSVVPSALSMGRGVGGEEGSSVKVAMFCCRDGGGGEWE